MNPKLLLTALLFCVACGTETSENSPDAGADAAADVATGGTCATYQDWLTDAVRSLPRTCETPADCLIVDRAGQCECALAVTLGGGDIAAFNTALQELDAHECRHPFACLEGMAQCSYQTPFEQTELLVTCEQNVCGLVELMACDAYVARKNGGIFPAGACETDDDCTLRDNLNPCGCQEALPKEFPFLLENAVFDLMPRNDTRCDFTCDGCPAVTEAFCDAGKCAAR